MRYAYFAQAHRLAIEVNGKVTIYDTLDHQIGGVQQQQGGYAGSLSFSSQFGTFTVDSLPRAGGASQHSEPQYSQQRSEPPQQSYAQTNSSQSSMGGNPQSHDEILTALERLGNLHQKGVLSDSIYQLIGGLRSGMGYLGCGTIDDLRTKPRFIRITQAGTREVMLQDYIRFARAKGLSRRATLWKHVLRNAMIPVLTIMGLQFANLITGTTGLLSLPAHAQLKNENLLVAMPDGYIVGFQDKNTKQQMTEMVPRGYERSPSLVSAVKGANATSPSST